jgi:hypothetical protein
MVRAGAIAKRVIQELGELGCDSKSGECPDDLKEEAKKAFEGRSIGDYYTEGMEYNSIRQKQPLQCLMSCLIHSFSSLRQRIWVEFPN